MAARAAPKTDTVSGLKIQQRSAAPKIGRHRDLVVRDEPVAVDLPEAGRVPNPGTDPVPVLRRAAEPIEAVPECHVIAHGDREVANLVTERRLEYRKGHFPIFQFYLCAHGLQRRSADVEGHHVRSETRPQTLKIHGADRLSQLVD